MASRRERPPPRPERERPAPRSDLLPRVLAAIPAILFALLIVGQGGLVFAAGLFVLGVLALNELYTLMRRVRPVNLAGFLTIGGLLAAGLSCDPQQQLVVAGL